LNGVGNLGIFALANFDGGTYELRLHDCDRFFTRFLIWISDVRGGALLVLAVVHIFWVIDGV
jgi:hypothetical protein